MEVAIILLLLAIGILVVYVVDLKANYRKLKEEDLHHRFHHRFKTLPTKTLEGYLDNKKKLELFRC